MLHWALQGNQGAERKWLEGRRAGRDLARRCLRRKLLKARAWQRIPSPMSLRGLIPMLQAEERGRLVIVRCGRHDDGSA
jgi:hypothetical protein